MHKKTFGKNMFFVAFSRGLSLVSNVFIGFLLPKFLSITDYGFYKVFTLYAVYTALLHFGFVDGILLKLSGKEYDELDYLKMRTFSKFFIGLETLISTLMIIISICILNSDYMFIAIMLAINMIFVNITTYYQFIAQAVQRFGEYSIKSMVASGLKLIFTGILFLLYYFKHKDISYKWFLIGLNIIELIMMAWYIFIYRKITFGKGQSLKSMKVDIIDTFKTGIILTLAYQTSHLVLVLDRQFVNALFSTETFAIYSFAYNIVSMISTMITSISVVLLPMLKKENSEVVVSVYSKSTITVSIIATFSLLSYFLISPFIKWFLPKYTDSINYISVVMSSFLFTAVIIIVMFTMAKVMNKNSKFFKESLISLVLGFITNVMAYLIFKSPIAISYASLLVMIIWFIISGLSLKKDTKVGIAKELIYLIIIAIGFLMIVNLMKNYVYGFLMYCLWAIVWTIIFYYKVIKKKIKKNDQFRIEG